MFVVFLRHKLISVLSALSAFFILSGALWAYFGLYGASGPLILHFSDLAGITQIGGAGNFLAVGLAGIAATAINFVLAVELELRTGFLGKLLAAATLFLALLLFLGFASIISVN